MFESRKRHHTSPLTAGYLAANGPCPFTARKKAKLPDLRIHDLRHSAASFMINAGIDLYAVGRILGHADHQSTMRYSHLADDTLLAAVEAGAAGLNLAPVNQPKAA